MKLLFAIVQDEDAKRLTKVLVENDIRVTRVSSSGGFLKSGNSTLMIGVEKDRLQDALDIIKAQSHRRQSLTAAPPIATQTTDSVPIPIEVTVGGATVFQVDVEECFKF